jgi:hypothetical protein
LERQRLAGFSIHDQHAAKKGTDSI